MFFPVHLDLLFVISKGLRFINLNEWYIKSIVTLLICIPIINFIKTNFPVLSGVVVKKRNL